MKSLSGSLTTPLNASLNVWAISNQSLSDISIISNQMKFLHTTQSQKLIDIDLWL